MIGAILIGSLAGTFTIWAMFKMLDLGITYPSESAEPVEERRSPREMVRRLIESQPEMNRKAWAAARARKTHTG